MWEYREPRKHIVEVMERRTCFGNPGYIDEWVIWDSYNELFDASIAMKRLESVFPDKKFRIRDYEKPVWVMK